MLTQPQHLATRTVLSPWLCKKNLCYLKIPTMKLMFLRNMGIKVKMSSGDVLGREDHFGDDGFLSYSDPIGRDKFL